MVNRAYIFIVNVLLLFMCTKETITSRPYPRVETDAVTNISSSGVQFNGVITYTPSDIIDYGFIWSTAQVPSFQYGNVLSLGSRSGIGGFTDILGTGGLTAGVEYQVCAYAKSSSYTVYGEIVSFVKP